jgi:hypothetical protein
MAAGISLQHSNGKRRSESAVKGAHLGEGADNGVRCGLLQVVRSRGEHGPKRQRRSLPQNNFDPPTASLR